MTSGQIKGPRPLSLHFSNSQVIWGAAAEGGSQALKDGLWHPQLHTAIAKLRQKVSAQGDEKAFEQAVQCLAQKRKETFLSGINSYLATRYDRPPSEAISCDRIGDVELLDFGGEGEPILMIPSLINPHYILDLMPGRSLASFLKKRGYRPYLVNWGAPGEEELGFGLDDYIMKRLVPFLDLVADVAGTSIPVIGYCMGGTLSVALAARMQDKVSKLVLLAAPWDFATDKPHAGRKFVPTMIEQMKLLPDRASIGVDMLQTFFASVDPTLNDRKFRSYAAGKYQGSQADFFSAMEVWANNGAPLARRAAEECMQGWYQDNDTMEENWMISGDPVRLSDIECPVWIAAPRGDRLVPQESAFAMLSGLKKGFKHEPPSGHIGMVVGDRAKSGLWEPLHHWLEAH